MSNKDGPPVPKQRKTKTNVKYQTLPDGKYSSTLAEETGKLEDGDASSERDDSSDIDSDSQSNRYYDCCDRCGR